MREKNKERRPSILNHYSTKNTKASTVTVKKMQKSRSEPNSKRTKEYKKLRR